MNKIRLFFETLVKNKSAYLVVIAIALASVLLAIASYEQRYNLSNIDGISYMSIASQYANGEIDYALNGYWSPMISWLMVPFIWLGIEPALGFRAINAAAGIFVIIVGAAFVWRVAKKRLLSTVSYVFLATLLIMSSYSDSLSPDIIALAWVLLFIVAVAEVFRRGMKSVTTRKALLAGGLLGIVGALGYFTKLYLLPVFLVVMFAIFVAGVALLFAKKNRQSGKNIATVAAVSVVVMAICMSPWVWAISDKYGYITIGSSFSQNVTAKFTSIIDESSNPIPASDSEPSPIEPVPDIYSLMPPPNETAIDPSEENTPYRDDRDNARAVAEENSKQPAGLVSRATAYMETRMNHIPYYLKNLTDIWFFTLLAPFIFLTLLMLVRHRKLQMSNQTIVVLTLLTLTLVVYASGYAAMTTQSSSAGESRYFLPVVLLAVLSFVIMNPYIAALLHKIIRWPQGLLLTIITIIIAAAMVFAHPIQLKALQGKQASPTGLHEASYLMRHDLDIDRGDNITSNNNRQTHRLSYLLGLSQYDLRLNGSNMDGLGQEPVDLSNQSLAEALQENSIKYYFEFRPTADMEPDVSDSNFQIIGSYDVGRLACEDARNAPHEQCRLYVIQSVNENSDSN